MAGQETRVLVIQPCEDAPSILEIRLSCGHVFFFPQEMGPPAVGMLVECPHHKGGTYDGTLRWVVPAEESANG